MDSLHSILFYVFAAVALAGAAIVITFVAADRRGAGIALLGLGLSGLYADLSAGFAAGVGLLCYLAMAALLAGPGSLTLVDRTRRTVAQHAAGPAMAVLFAAACYAAFRADFERGSYPGGSIGTAVLGHILFGRDALAVVAVGAMLLCAAIGIGMLRSTRR